jgi:predicted phosphoribosyltransferase
VLNRSAIVALGITREQLEQVVKEETTELDRRLQRYRGDRPLPDLRDRTVIVVDDGLATGVSAMVAIRAIREHQPRRIVLAVPVCAPETADELRGEVDEVVCAARPQNFLGVGLWYERFDPTTDEEVLELLERARETVSPSR